MEIIHTKSETVLVIKDIQNKFNILREFKSTDCLLRCSLHFLHIFFEDLNQSLVRETRRVLCEYPHDAVT